MNRSLLKTKQLLFFCSILLLIVFSGNAFSQTEKTEQKVYENVDNPPMPVGGMKGLQKNIVYPEEAKKAGTQGKVFLKAIINTDGSIEKIEVTKSDNKILNQAAIDAVQKTKFTPGKNKGKFVKTEVVIPIIFKLE